jgi:hypothetical protein
MGRPFDTLPAHTPSTLEYANTAEELRLQMSQVSDKTMKAVEFLTGLCESRHEMLTVLMHLVVAAPMLRGGAPSRAG